MQNLTLSTQTWTDELTELEERAKILPALLRVLLNNAINSEE
jgi:hypothetical protein